MERANCVYKSVIKGLSDRDMNDSLNATVSAIIDNATLLIYQNEIIHFQFLLIVLIIIILYIYILLLYISMFFLCHISCQIEVFCY